ncbi:Alpha/Beta hydrolase protein [Biscogniauxia marginata]|nr:Alpha/Beta hydrolase protein [Biscogniauxia marginata]
MTSHAPSQCCTTGSLHEGTATGSIRNIGQISTYVAYPADKSTKRAVLLLTDVIGHKFINAQLIADEFARNGYFVVIPDLFAGDAVPLNPSQGFNFMNWIQNHLPGQIDPIVEAVLTEMRGQLGCERIAGVGYCFGGKYVCRFLKQGKLDVGFAAHPSMVDADELKEIQGPLSIAAAVKDEIFTAAKRHESEEILGQIGVPYQINLFSDVEHGFSVRCDLSQPRQKFAKEQSFAQAVGWLKQYL